MLGHVHHCWFCVLFSQKKGALRVLKTPFILQVPKRVGCHATVCVCKAVALNNDPTTNEYTCISTLVCGYTVSRSYISMTKQDKSNKIKTKPNNTCTLLKAVMKYLLCRHLKMVEGTFHFARYLYATSF